MFSVYQILDPISSIVNCPSHAIPVTGLSCKTVLSGPVKQAGF